MLEREKVAVVGLGYVGLPLAGVLSRHFPDLVGFDVGEERIAAIQQGEDHTESLPFEDMARLASLVTHDPSRLRDCTFYIVAVPTPVDSLHRPDLRNLAQASQTIGATLRRGSVVVYESTVYPGATEDFCGPILAQTSGLRRGLDFSLGYSPERVNPGDAEHGVEGVVKIIAGEDRATLMRMDAVYRELTQAGLHRAPSIRVAEAAKVIENTQRDLNIALMNELSLIFTQLDIDMLEVLAAAGTKWNFLPFTPGLVGGHCIGVDPYYLTYAAELAGFRPEIILAGRRINDEMGRYVARSFVKRLAQAKRHLPESARVAVLGLTFKENVRDIRNSRSPDIVHELQEFGLDTFVHDPVARVEDAKSSYSIQLAPWDQLRELHGIILAVPHAEYLSMDPDELLAPVLPGGVIFDVKGALDRTKVRDDLVYLSL